MQVPVQLPAEMLSTLLDRARAQGATGADAVLFETVEASTSRRLGKQEGLERAESKAIGLRAFFGAQQAMASSTDMSAQALSELAERTVAMARATPPDPDSMLAPAALRATAGMELQLCDREEPDAAWLSGQCTRAEDAALAVAGITNSEGADAQYSRSRITLALDDGSSPRFIHGYDSSHFALSVSVLAGSGTGMERDYDFTSARFRDDLHAAEAIGRNAAARALKRLNPRKVPTARVPVVFDPRLSKGLLSILAGAISGSSIARGSSFLKDDLHNAIFSPQVTIIDDPHIVRGLGSKPFDGEGVQNGKRAIVEHGELKSWLLDTRTANKLGLTTTGHATRGLASPPSPAPTNLYLQPGTLSPQALMQDIKSGFYVTETFGMGVNTVTGDYSQGAAGFWIEDGEIAYPVSEITIAGHLRDMFRNMTPANDLVFRYATNAPTIRIEAMTVAGT